MRLLSVFNDIRCSAPIGQDIGIRIQFGKYTNNPSG